MPNAMKNPPSVVRPIGEPAPPSGWLDRLSRRVVLQRLADVTGGEIRLQDPAGTTPLGQPSGLEASLQVHRPRFFRSALLGGSLAVAESYLRGDWDCDDLTSLFRIFARQGRSDDRLDRSWTSRLARGVHRLYHWRHANTRRGSRRNIAAHYDLGNEFYRLWLDDTLAYSCALFRDRQTPLGDASRAKFDRVCRWLELSPEDELLEIGTGWGGFAIHAVENFACHVTTTTISRQQHQTAAARIQDAGLQGRITLLQQDYRDLRGQFDKLASIEMIEAVGARYLDAYFRQCSRLLRPDGTLVLQAIVMPEQGYSEYLRSVDFIQRYVFPGGCLPSLGAMVSSVGRATDLLFVQSQDLSPHYAETLRRWRRTFEQRLDDVRDLGYPERLIRLWRYYLCYCEAAFEERSVGVLQLQFDKPRRRRELPDGRPSHALQKGFGSRRPPTAVCGQRR